MQFSLRDLSLSAQANESQRSNGAGALAPALAQLLICVFQSADNPAALTSELKWLQRQSGVLTPRGAGGGTSRSDAKFKGVWSFG